MWIVEDNLVSLKRSAEFGKFFHCFAAEEMHASPGKEHTN